MNIFPRYYRILQIAARVGTICAVSLYTIPHIFPVRTIEASFQLPCIEVPKQYYHVLQETCKKMDMDYKDIDLYFTNSFSTVSAGTTYLKNKCVIGLPRNFSFQNESDIRQASICFQDMPIDWDSKTGKALIEVFLPDVEHLKFLLGHELSHIKNSHFVMNALHAGGCFYGFTKLAIWLPTRIPFEIGFERLLISHFIYLIAVVCLYQVMKQFINHHIEYTADKQSALLGKDYCIGGISYMKTRLRLNRVLRFLNGDEGEKMYSEDGNNLKDVYSHPKRTDRMKNLKEISRVQCSSQDL